MKGLFLKIHGQVQGVFFREFVRKNAERLEIKGYVRNCEDGTVEVGVSGEEKNLNELIKLIKQGPELSKVDHIEIKWKDNTQGFDEFQVLYK